MSFVYPIKYDVIVVGGGHAGCEAAFAASRIGCKTLLLTMNIDTIALMSCNPAIGGIGKAQLVKEIDALGGIMGIVTDLSAIQYRYLNTKKGQAVRSLRAQTDRTKYRLVMRRILEKVENLDIKQGEVVRLLVKGKEVYGVETRFKTQFLSKTVVLCLGTFMEGLIHIGLESFPAGRFGEFGSELLPKNLRELGFILGRFKTGTPARLDGRTIDYSRLTPQYGDEEKRRFSFRELDIDIGIKREEISLPCYITYTNPKTHQIIKENLDRSPLYAGIIKATGVRYCPSIEDKVVKFSHKDRHQIFIEPDGVNTYEVYPNGISTSLPIDVQIKMLRTIEGLERVEIVRPGYAIEHNYFDPTQLYPTLETKLYENLFIGGQIVGTTGYEEAGATGIIAGINAALKALGKEMITLKRSQAYIGVLIDDLVTKGTNEPYRMFTSRVEFRLLLREENADLRLGEIGYKIGLLKEEDYKKILKKKEGIEKIKEWLKRERLYPKEEINNKLKEWGTSIKEPISLYELLKRPEIDMNKIIQFKNPPLDIKENEDLFWNVEIDIKYEGYINRSLKEIEKLKELEDIEIPENFDYYQIPSLSNEAKEKLSKIRPKNLAQAQRIPGINPTTILNLLIYLKK
ncbi:MAG: tRNA uridine-5-carboxymethylaminomethyl(34) synthesis enzyme MnmG [candidate division WOR-3 bacterium]|nr:tRNA uridine-5-carboxymethylaminomethyl(34) synthesis enzyme MnmG [candidate division WOR-3 bacterium]MCX7836912.1 tRNA uridine-5-carboxymethylaminomethyl(34) synthesis enzyme MnmG [candidate division WOR-3 bacterium]MDW8114655.1 tRNA uridine-5-carboxymethylaminomethyl(34) synthesis enzyme MnmG [candidate division WOR-3 bacterium]